MVAFRWIDTPRHILWPSLSYYRRVMLWRMAWAAYIATYYPQFGAIAGGEC